MRVMRQLAVVALVLLVAATGANSSQLVTYRIDHVTDGDTVVLRNGERVRLVQIDTPEVSFGAECYGRQASATTKRLLPEGSRVRLDAEPATDRVDDFGRLLRYVVRTSDGVNVNIALVAIGAAAPYFYEGRRGMYASQLEILAKSARAKRRGLWGACPRGRGQPRDLRLEACSRCRTNPYGSQRDDPCCGRRLAVEQRSAVVALRVARVGGSVPPTRAPGGPLKPHSRSRAQLRGLGTQTRARRSLTVSRWVPRWVRWPPRRGRL
jgi:endonuclease YncB( thermonuclease family)